jgi:hypothetical protein
MVTVSTVLYLDPTSPRVRRPGTSGPYTSARRRSRCRSQSRSPDAAAPDLARPGDVAGRRRRIRRPAGGSNHRCGSPLRPLRRDERATSTVSAGRRARCCSPVSVVSNPLHSVRSSAHMGSRKRGVCSADRATACCGSHSFGKGEQFQRVAFPRAGRRGTPGRGVARIATDVPVVAPRANLRGPDSLGCLECLKGLSRSAERNPLNATLCSRIVRPRRGH